MVIKIATGNQKGGIGKTIVNCLFAEHLAEKGYRVLMIDFDPQAHATNVFDYKYEFKDRIEKDMYSGFENLNDAVINVKENLDIIAGSGDIKNLEKRSHTKSQRKALSMLKDALTTIEDNYDFIIFDTPPTASGFYVQNALFASDYFITLTEVTRNSIDSMIAFYQEIEQMREDNNLNLEMLGILINRRIKDDAIYDELREEYFFDNKEMYFENSISFQRRISKYSDWGVYEYTKKNPKTLTNIDRYDKIIHEELEKVVDEMIRRIKILQTEG